MAFYAQVQKYCTKLPRSERSQLTRRLDVPRDISKLITKSLHGEITSKTDIKEYVCYKCLLFLAEIKFELAGMNFTSLNSFISAAWAFFSLIMIVLLNTPRITREDVDRMVTNLKPYILLYIVVDHTLDNNEEAFPIFKEEFAKTLGLGRNSTTEASGKEVRYACALMERIMQLSPLSVPFMANAARVEFSTVSLQKGEHDTLKMCYDKGSSSTLAGCAIMNNGTIYPGTETIGKMGQLFDDIVDIEEDNITKIKTFATESLARYGNIDNCVDIMGGLVEELPDSYKSSKCWLLYMLSTYFVNSMFITQKLRVKLLDYSLLLYKGHNSNPQYFAPFTGIFEQIK
jgi:signal transduction histidine kinase